MRRLPSLFVIAATVAACAPAPVVVDFNFPNAAAFVNSEQARLRIFPLTRDRLGLCPELIDGLVASRFPVEAVYDSMLQNRCEFRAGIEVPEFGAGPHAYVAEVRSTAGDVIMTGCTIAEVFVGAESIRLELQPTDAYAALVAMPVAGTPESVCAGGTP